MKPAYLFKRIVAERDTVLGGVPFPQGYMMDVMEQATPPDGFVDLTHEVWAKISGLPMDKDPAIILAQPIFEKLHEERGEFDEEAIQAFILESARAAFVARIDITPEMLKAAWVEFRKSFPHGWGLAEGAEPVPGFKEAITAAFKAGKYL